MADFESIVDTVDKVRGNFPLERTTGRSGGQGVEGVEVARGTLAEDDGGSGILGGVGESDGLAGLDRLGPGVELNGESGRDEGSARQNKLEETHVVWFGGV